MFKKHKRPYLYKLCLCLFLYLLIKPITLQSADKKLNIKRLPNGQIKVGNIKVDPKKKEITFLGYLSTYKPIDLEVLICTPYGRTHETVLIADILPVNLQLALLLLGKKNGARLKNNQVQQGDMLKIELTPLFGSKKRKFNINELIFNKKTEEIMKENKWVFVGTNFKNSIPLANQTGNIVNIWSFSNTILDNPSKTGNSDDFMRLDLSYIGINQFIEDTTFNKKNYKFKIILSSFK